MSVDQGTVIEQAAPSITPAPTPPTDIAQPPSGATSPAPEAPREPRPETVALVEAIVPTFEQMMRKPVRRDTIEFLLPQEDGEPLTVKAELEAIDGPAYDALQAKYPPNAMQRARQQSYDPDKFGPALLSRVVKTPSFTEEQWAQLWANPRWSGGEISSLFNSAMGICLQGLNVPLSSSG